MTLPLFSRTGSGKCFWLTGALAGALALALSLPVSAAMYKSVDANGRVTYSDKPPVTQKDSEKTDQMRDVPPPGDPGAAKALSQKEADFQKRVNDRQEGEKKAADEQAKAADKTKRCQNARVQLNQYKDEGIVLYRANEKGEREAMNMDARKAEAARLEDDMKKFGCQ